MHGGTLSWDTLRNPRSTTLVVTQSGALAMDRPYKSTRPLMCVCVCRRLTPSQTHGVLDEDPLLCVCALTLPASESIGPCFKPFSHCCVTYVPAMADPGLFLRRSLLVDGPTMKYWRAVHPALLWPKRCFDLLAQHVRLTILAEPHAPTVEPQLPATRLGRSSLS